MGTNGAAATRSLRGSHEKIRHEVTLILKSISAIFGQPSTRRIIVLLFLMLWLAYGSAINSNNLLDFNLQQIGVEAMVERGHFYLEGSTSPYLQTKGDVFEYNGHKYAAKQHGEF